MNKMSKPTDMTYAVQISPMNKYKMSRIFYIEKDRYNFKSKADAFKWAIENLYHNQYALIVYMPKYRKANDMPSIHKIGLAWDKGKPLGIVRWFANKPVFVDDSEKYMWDINPNYRLVNKRSIPESNNIDPLAELDKAYSQTQKELRRLM